ncbi:hypothetical protein ACOZ4N_00150 (plasmid) [Halorientalis pallida]|uniref:hypothetical protein n=1 Tax=Halorientalis pallida TaxID=2479928 RepID=UPI003C703A21
MASSLRAESLFYHTTHVKHIPAILREGIQPIMGNSRQSIAQDLTAIAERHCIELPINRQKCVFLYQSLPLATEFLWVPPNDQSALGSREGIVVVDASQLGGKLYVGDFSLFSDAIDFQYLDEPDETMLSESYDGALRRYAKSLTPLKSFESTNEIHAAFDIPEVVVEDGIGPDLIVECVFLKTVRSGQN